MRRRLVLALGAIAVPTLFAFACSLDLDESLIDRKDGGAVIGDVVVPEGATVTESGVIENPAAAACTKDEECVSANGCLTGRCDLARRACSFEVCRTAACTAGNCEEATRTCSAPAPYKRQAAAFNLAQPFACANCLVAAYPFLFVGSQGGVLAYNVANPGNATPAPIPIVGLGFVPNRMVRSGNRVWFAASTSGQAAGPGRVPLAYIDVPSDPFAGVIKATTILVEAKGPPVTPRLYPRDNRGLYLVAPPPSYATALVEATVADNAVLSPNAFALPADRDIFAASASRLVALTTAGDPLVNLVTNAGAGTVTLDKQIALDIGPTSDARRLGYAWATSADGAVFWAGASNVALPEPLGGVRIGRVRAYFLTANGTSAIPDAPAGVDVETYPEGAAPPGDADVVRFPMFLDNDTVMLASAAQEDIARVALDVVKRGQPPTVLADRRVLLGVNITNVVATSASDGIGYVGTNEKLDRDAASPDTGRVYAIAPDCAP